MPKRKTFEEFSKDFHDSLKEGEMYTLISNTYKNNREKIKVKHEQCGLIYEVTPDKFLMGRRCPVCWKKDTVKFKKEVFDLVGDEYSVIGEYKGKTTPIKMKHELCGRIYDVQPAVFLKGHRCASCSKDKKTNDTFIEEVKNLVGDEYKFLEEYKTNKYPLLVEHSCGFQYKVSPTNFLHGYRCPKCSLELNQSGRSKKEIEVLEFIKDIYKDEIIEGYRPALEGVSLSKTLELDIYIPDLKIGFEYDGLYWHSDKKKDKDFHINKTIFFKDLGVRVIHIFEDEWLNKQEIVKSKIRNILKVSDSEKIAARKITVREITNKEKTLFLDSYHIQGSDHSGIKLGGFYNDELITVMTFSKLRNSLGSRKKNPGEYELSRYATSKNVIGGFSKLLKYATRNYDINYIKTFADLRWSDFKNNVYSKNGFTVSHISDPNYFYIPFSSKMRYHRFNFRKQVLKERFPEFYEDKLTEFQIMDKTNYSRIWDCGNLVYEIKIDKKDKA